MSEQQAETIPLKTPTAEEVRANLMGNINQHYINLLNFVKRLPLAPNLVQNAVLNLDQGMMWLEQAVKGLKFEAPQPETKEPENAETTEKTAEGQEAA